MPRFKKAVYLAGAISYFYKTEQHHRATRWRDKAKAYLGQFDIKCFNPCDEPEDCWQYPHDVLFNQNYFYLNNCDIVLVNLDKINDSVGTVWELAMAWRDHKAVVAFGQTVWMDRPHMQSLITVRFDTMEEAVEYIADMYGM